jgi:hypothetical protein
MRLDEVERQKRSEEERVRIVIEKEKYLPKLQARIKEETASIDKLQEENRWRQLTEEYHKSYDTAGPKLSTFINAFEEERY